MPGRHERRQSNTQKPSASKKKKNVLTSQQKRRRRIILWSSVGATVLAVAGGAYAAIVQSGNRSWRPPNPIPIPSTERNRLTTLLIGTDTRSGQSGGNTDVLILMSLDYAHKRIELLSIPRDTKVQFPDGTYGKINAAYDVGGVALTDRLVQDLTGIDSPNYAITHFGGLVNIINTIGGISLNVPERMNFNTGDKIYGIINLFPGQQTLTGEQALGFVRFREDPLGDIGRTMRQQTFLKALEKALFQPSNLPRLPKLITEFWGTVDSNYSLGNVISVASGASQLRGFKVISETLPGAYHNPTFPGDPSYWIVNAQEAQWVSKQLFYDGIIQPNIFQTEQQVQNWTPPLPGENPTANQVVTPDNTNHGPSTSGSSASKPPTATTSGNTAATSGSSTSAQSSSTSTSTPSSSSTPTTAVAPEQMVVTTSANIRSGPGTNYAVVGSLLQGQKVTVIGKAGDWDQVPLSNGASGYIAGFLLGTP